MGLLQLQLSTIFTRNNPLILFNNQLPPAPQVGNSAQPGGAGTFSRHYPIHVGQTQITLNGDIVNLTTEDGIIYYVILTDRPIPNQPPAAEFEIIAGPGGRVPEQ